MSRMVKKLISIPISVVLTALFIVFFMFALPQIAEVPENTGAKIIERKYSRPEAGTVEITEKEYIVGRDITAVSIKDLSECGKITKVNYVPNEFTKPGSLSDKIQIADIGEQTKFAEKGTLIFIITNLDPLDGDYYAQCEALSPFKLGDYWQFTLILPEIFCASNVYQKSSLVSRTGEIENYDFISFTTSYDKQTQNFKKNTSTIELNLRFYTRSEAYADALSSAAIITVHYQSAGGIISGIRQAPVVGDENTVIKINNYSQNLLLSFMILSAVVVVVFVALCILKSQPSSSLR